MNEVDFVSELDPCKRYVTTHNVNGKSVYADAPPHQYHRIGKAGGAARSWSIESVPAKLAGDADLKAYSDPDTLTSYKQSTIVTGSGANLIIVDFLPGAHSQMHQTVSIDFFGLYDWYHRT
jgi:hypothetical protein